MLIPKVDPNYIEWGHFDLVKTLVESKRFAPLYLYGMSGNGKTAMVEQVCAQLQRKFVRIQITPETNESDLIGGWRLIDGNTEFVDGAVILAMREGAILLIDEIDRGTNKLMALQGVLEGKPVMIKKTKEIVHPHEDFNVIATANTNGRGSQDGRFNAAGILDEAFIERFAFALEQNYPDQEVESLIVTQYLLFLSDKKSLSPNVTAELGKLVSWTKIIRDTYFNDGIDDVISTRRLLHIVHGLYIYKNAKVAINLGIQRFDVEVRTSFMSLYEKL